MSVLLSLERMTEGAGPHGTRENKLCRVLDVALREDAARFYNDSAAQNLAIIRKMALKTVP
jgi:predicted transposase YbfD/YdcC